MPRNVAKLQSPPRVQAGEMAILDRDGINTLIADLRGHVLYPRAILALFTGLRLGEILALGWRNVDLDAKVIRVRAALEETKEHGAQVKAPKTRAPAAGTCLCRPSWSTRCAITGASSSRSAWRSASAGCQTMPSYSPSRFQARPRPPARPLGHGGS